MEEKKGFKEWLEKNTVLALVCALVLGLLIGAGTMYFCNRGGKVASVKGKTITSKSLYNRMKNYLSIDFALEEIDNAILNKKYTLDDEEKEEVKKTAQGYIDMYESYYGQTQEEFLSGNGFDSFEDFADYLSLDYKRTIYFYDVLEKQLDENAVKEYYDENAFGKVNTKHILVKTSEDITDEKALSIANEIIGRLDNGEDFDTVAKEYESKYEETIVVEDLGEKGAFDHLENAYVEGMKELNKGEYSKTPVKTSYGYHVIYCIDKIEKSDKISRKDRMEIVEELSSDIISNDSNLYYKTLIKMREDSKLKFFDKNLEEKYVEYCSKYEDKETNHETENETESETETNISIEE